MSGSAKPSAIGRYRVIDVLGRGSMGIVYRAHDPVIDRDVAIKLVHLDTAEAEQQADTLARFRKEVQAAGRCAHPGIVAVYDFLEQDGDPAIVMELVDGTSLQRHLRDSGRRMAVPPRDVLLPVLDALGHAHALGIVHRDIKPANILITTTGKVKIADFGIARVAGAGNATKYGLMMGTPSYMAPEQVEDDNVDARTDLFSVGAVLFEMVSGKPPFAGSTLTETILRLSGPEPVDLKPVLKAGGHDYADILQQALAKAPAHRFQTSQAFATALQAVAAGIQPDDPQETVVFSPRKARAWDPVFLQQLEQQLARFSGPVARMTILRAAASSASNEELYASLARSLANTTDRTLFLRAVGSGRVEPTFAASRSPEATSSRGTRPPPARVWEAKAIPAEAIAAAQAALVVYTGPIARVLVRDAASQAVSPSDFIERLCAHVTRPDELAKLRRQLKSEVEPKLL